MITIPLYVFLFLYLAFLCVFLVFSFVHIYHIFATASFTLASFTMTLFIMVLTIYTLYFTFQLLVGLGWTQPVTLFSADWLPGIFGNSSTF